MSYKVVNEQELQAYVDRAVAEALTTEPYDIEYARECTAGLYKLMEVEQPEVKLFDGPGAAWDWVEEQLGQEVDFVFPAYTGSTQRAFFAAGEYLSKEHGVDMDDAFKLFVPVTNLCMVWPLEDVCIVSQPPEFYRFDEDQKLHCEDGPAMRFRDGSEVWCIHGLDVDEQIVMRPETQELRQMINERNTDVRAIRIERFGWLPFLEQTGAAVLDERENVIEGTYEVLFESRVGNRLVATCNTGRIICLGIEPGIRTCEEAQAYLRGGRKTNIIARS